MPNPKAPHHDKVIELARTGMPPAEIARTLGVARGSVGSIIFRARQSGSLPRRYRSPTECIKYWRRGRGGPAFGKVCIALEPQGVPFAEWLSKNTPEGSTLADTLVAIAVDVWQEEMQHEQVDE